MDGYVATFDSSIVGEDAGTVKQSTNRQSSESECTSQHTGLNNESNTNRLTLYQHGEGAYLNTKASGSSGKASDCLQPAVVGAFSHRTLNGEWRTRGIVDSRGCL
jgi:hypothetical protein